MTIFQSIGANTIADTFIMHAELCSLERNGIFSGELYHHFVYIHSIVYAPG